MLLLPLLGAAWARPTKLTASVADIMLRAAGSAIPPPHDRIGSETFSPPGLTRIPCSASASPVSLTALSFAFGLGGARKGGRSAPYHPAGQRNQLECYGLRSCQPRYRLL